MAIDTHAARLDETGRHRRLRVRRRGSARWGARPGVRARWAKNAGWYLFLTALSLLVLYPIWMTIVRAISTPLPYIEAHQPLWWVRPQWDIFWRAFTQGDMGRAFLISAIMTTVIVVAQLVTSVLAAYAFAFLEFPLKRLMFVVVIATLMLPIEVTLIANVKTIREVAWLGVDSIQSLSAPFLAAAFGIFLIRQGFLGVPKDLRDAATLDGFGHMGFLWRVAVPVARPIIASFIVVSFLSAWNQYTWPRAVTETSSWNTVQIALREVSTTRVDQLNIGFAAAIVAALPILAILIIFQRHLIRGLTAGAVKG